MLTLMKSALLSIFGASLLAATVGCDGGSDTPTGPVMTTGGASTAGAGAGPSGAGTSGSGTGGTGTSAEGVPLIGMNGWVDASAAIGIQGALFAYGDDTTLAGPPMMSQDFVDANACIKGVAAKVPKMCTPKPPATDCYGTFWGAAIGLNLNQPIDPTTMKGVDPPLSYDGSAIKGFSFKISGATVPSRLRFKVEGAGAVEFCNPGTKPVKIGENTLMLSDLITECWTTPPKPTAMNAESAKSALTKIAWQVYTVDSGTTEFDYCVSDVRVIK